MSPAANIRILLTKYTFPEIKILYEAISVAKIPDQPFKMSIEGQKTVLLKKFTKIQEILLIFAATKLKGWPLRSKISDIRRIEDHAGWKGCK
jgi:hypothetical protein